MTTIALIGFPLAESWGVHGAGWMAVMMIPMALFWGALILGAIWLIRNGFERGQRKPEETAFTILDHRFAAGTLSLDDYQERRDVLAGTAAPRPDQGVSQDTRERSER